MKGEIAPGGAFLAGVVQRGITGEVMAQDVVTHLVGKVTVAPYGCLNGETRRNRGDT